MKLPQNSIEWALKHVTRYYSSDFFPEPFEFEAVKSQWNNVRSYLEGLDLNEYTPKQPFRSLAPKPNGTFRVVHQLDPLDSLIYTALVHMIAEDIEAKRIPNDDGIACSYRIDLDVNGSFFTQTQDGWDRFNKRTKDLIEEFSDGFILICDIVDFYNQIYSHRLKNVICELSRRDAEKIGKVIEDFIHNLNDKTSRGIPVGPAASIVLSEALMIDIDRKILLNTRDYTRWVDDFRIFFSDYYQARLFLHEFTSYLYDNHRLVLSGEKTKILSVSEFNENYFLNDVQREQRMIMTKSQALLLEEYQEELFEDICPYLGPEEEFDNERYEELLEEFRENENFRITSEAYEEFLEEEFDKENPDYTIIRKILRNAKNYNIESILPSVLENFENLLPLIRELCLYLKKIMTQQLVQQYRDEIENIINSPTIKIPYINIWLAWLFSSQSFLNEEFGPLLNKFLRIRDRAFYALQCNKIAWVKSHKSGLDTLGPHDKRGVLNSLQIISADEQKISLHIAKKRGSYLEKTLADHLLAKL